MRKTFLLIPSLALVLAGCGGGSYLDRASAHAGSGPTCPKAWAAGWQKLADRIHAPVYCPSWLPEPLTGQIGGRSNSINSVSKDRSYLIGFIWQELGEEVHVNLRGYPGVRKVPTCKTIELVGGKAHRGTTPCFADSRGAKTIAGYRVTTYTVNQDADQWHVLYAWTHEGSLYTLSQHVAPPLTYPKVVQDLNRELAGLQLIEPR